MLSEIIGSFSIPKRRKSRLIYRKRCLFVSYPFNLIAVEPARQEPKGVINPPDPDPRTGWVGLGRVQPRVMAMSKLKGASMKGVVVVYTI